MIIEVTIYNTKAPMFINTDKIIKFYKPSAESRCTYIHFDYDEDGSVVMPIEEEPQWLAQKINEG